jgi:hypothetical protein
MVHARLKGLVEQDPCLTRPPSCTRVGGHLSRLYTRTSTSYPFFRGSLRTSMMTVLGSDVLRRITHCQGSILVEV